MSGSGLLRRRTPVALAAVLAAALAASIGGATSSAADPKPGKAGKAATTKIQILGLNDFHGAMEPPTGSGGRIGALTNEQCVQPVCVPAGGVEYLATHVDQLRATNPNTLFVSAGDLIGATPLLSALFHDEPTIEAFNAMQLDYNGVGNHEFDEGVDELLRMQDGGCHPVDGCLDGDGFSGADFDFLAANVSYKDSGDTIFAPYKVHEFPGVDVAVIGMTLEGTPTIVSPEGIKTVDFADEAETVNNLIPELKAQGVETVIVLLHEGGSVTTPGNGTGSVTGIDDCEGAGGAIPPIVNAMDDEVDVVVTGHTNWAVNCEIDGKIVTGAGSNGRLVTDIDLTVSRATKEVLSATVDNEIVTRDVPKAGPLTDLIAKYNTIVGPIAAEVVGETAVPLQRTNSSNPVESQLGDVIADAQLAATAAPEDGGAVIALMNPGGVRADLDLGPVTYGEAFAVQPFANILTTVTLTGAELKAILEQQRYSVTSSGTVNATFLQPSEGFSFTFTLSAPAGSRVTGMMLNGEPIDPATSYRVTANNFLTTGGDGFTAFLQGDDIKYGIVDLDALTEYMDGNILQAPAGFRRISVLP